MHAKSESDGKYIAPTHTSPDKATRALKATRFISSMVKTKKQPNEQLAYIAGQATASRYAHG